MRCPALDSFSLIQLPGPSTYIYIYTSRPINTAHCNHLYICRAPLPWYSSSQGSPHLQTQLQTVPILSPLYLSLILFSSLTFPGASYRIFLLFLLWLPCHFYLAITTTTNLGDAGCVCYILYNRVPHFQTSKKCYSPASDFPNKLWMRIEKGIEIAMPLTALRSSL